jgi:hypothetical protein
MKFMKCNYVNENTYDKKMFTTIIRNEELSFRFRGYNGWAAEVTEAHFAGMGRNMHVYKLKNVKRFACVF